MARPRPLDTQVSANDFRNGTEGAAALGRRLLDTPPEPVFDDLVRLAGQICRAPMAAIALAAEGRLWFKAETGLDVPEIPLPASVNIDAVLHPELLVIPDTARDPCFAEHPLITAGPDRRFYAGAPLETSEGCRIGVLCIVDVVPRPGGLNGEQAFALGALARQVMALVEPRRATGGEEPDPEDRTSAGAALRDAQARAEAAATEYAAVLNQLAEGVVVADASGRIVLVNEAAARLHGVSRLGVATPDYSRTYGLFTEDGQPYPPEDLPLSRALRGETVEDRRWRIRRPDGSEILAIGSARPLTGSDGRRTGAVLTLRDDTARQAAEAALRTGEARLKALIGLGDRLRELRDGPDIAETAAEIAGRALGAASAGYGTVDIAERNFTVQRDWTTGAIPSGAGTHRLDDYWTGFAAELKRDETVAVEDVATDRRLSPLAAERYLAAGVRAFLNVPVIRRNRLAAILYVQHTAPRRWSPEDTVFARDVADRVSAALKRARAETEVRRLNETLEAQVAERTRERDRIWRLSRDMMLVAHVDGRIEAVNPAWTLTLGWSEEELVGTNFFDLIHPDDAAGTAQEVAQQAQGLPTLRFENRYRCKGGGYRWLSWMAVPESGLIHAVARDVTAEKEAEEALRRSEERLRQFQKMEAVGQLTGGIAHDFNNLLQAVMGCVTILRDRVGNDATALRLADGALAATERGAKLTSRLLAFSRIQKLETKPVDVNALVVGLHDLLAQSAGALAEVRQDLADGLPPAMADPNQLENALINLVVNARDAMPSNGRILIGTRRVVAGDGDPDLIPGAYVEVSVTDTGAGMPPEVTARAFEPFFTTKPVGRGTGLGLSQVYAFARQAGGTARIESAPGHGTTVRILLPVAAGAMESDGGREDAREDPALRAHVLLVDDEADVRAGLAALLEASGCTVREAADGLTGLALLREAETRTDVLVVDYAMPGMNGAAVALAARRIRPDLPVVFVTGYADMVEIGTVSGAPVVRKPVRREELVATLRRVIGRQEP